MSDIQIATASAHVPGYLAVPGSGAGPAAIVLQEWWAVDGHIRSVCDRLAGEGFFALAPELNPGAAPSEQAGGPFARSIRTAAQDVCAIAEHLRRTPGVHGPGVGTIGFGGGLAIWAAATCPQIAATVSYYCLLPHDKPDFAHLSGPVLGHFGAADSFISLKDAKTLETEIRNAGVSVEFEKYTGAGHGFFNENGRSGAYETQAAERSWERSVAFLRSNLAAPAAA